jgi:hypothetical protein
MRTVSTINGDFDLERFKVLNRGWKKAVKESKKEFNFEGKMMLTGYAKWLVEYLKPTFGGIK